MADGYRQQEGYRSSPLIFRSPPLATQAAGATDDEIAAAKKGSTLMFKGQPVGLIVAKSRREAEAACSAIRVTYSFDGLPKGAYTVKDAIAAGRTAPPMVNTRGDVDAEFAKPGLKIVEGAFSIGGQSHFCMRSASDCASEERAYAQFCCTPSAAG